MQDKFFYVGDTYTSGDVLTRSKSNGYKSIRFEGVVATGITVKVDYVGEEIVITAIGEPTVETTPWLFLTDEIGVFDGKNIKNDCNIIFADDEKMLLFLNSGCVFFKLNGEVNATAVNCAVGAKPNGDSVCWMSAANLRSMVKDAWDYCFKFIISGEVVMKKNNKTDTRTYKAPITEVRRRSAEDIDLSLGYIEMRNRREAEHEARKKAQAEAKKAMKRVTKLKEAFAQSDTSAEWSDGDDGEDDDEGWVDVD